MIVREVMSSKPDYISPENLLMDTAEKMRDNDFGFFPVGENDRLVGAITDRDIAIRAVASGWDPASTKVRDVMSPKVLYCYEDDDIKDAAHNMELNQIQRLIVLNDKKRMTGILSLSDVARNCDDNLCGELVEKIKEE